MFFKLLNIARNIWHDRYIDKRYKAELRAMQSPNYIRKKLPPELKKEYRDYYASFGFKHVSLDWIEYIYSVKGEFDVGYIPDNLYHKYIDPLFPTLTREVQDKAYQPFVMAGLAEYPVTVVKNIQGAYLDGGNRFITKDEALRLIHAQNTVVIKPTLFTGAGLNVKSCAGTEVDDSVFSDYDRDFIVQEKIRQSSMMVSLNESSVNTVKIFSFFFKGKIYILASELRVGAQGAHIDSIASKGAYWIKINPNGCLDDKGYNFFSEMRTETAAGEKFSAYRIPCYDEIVRTVKEGHRRLLHHVAVSWDFAIGENNRPILVEYNFKGHPIIDYEVNSGPLFGAVLDDVLREAAEYRRKRNRGNG